MKGIGIQTAGHLFSLKLMSAVLIILLLWAGSSSAQLPVCSAPGNTVLTVSCELDQNWTVAAGLSGYIIGADGVVIDGAGFTLTGDVSSATCTATQTDPCTTHSGVVNNDYSNVVVKNLEIENFCTGVVVGSSAATVENMTVEKCNIHDCGDSASITHGIHIAGASNCTIKGNEIFNQDGTADMDSCGSGGNGISMHGVISSGGDWNIITCNNLHDNAKCGLHAKSQCMHNTISYNLITDNAGAGIMPQCKSSNYNTIEYNYIKDNGPYYGIFTRGSNNVIRHNTIINTKGAQGHYNGLYILTAGPPSPNGRFNTISNNSVCQSQYEDILIEGDANDTNDVNDNTCNISAGGTGNGCPWDCNNLVSVYFDFDDDSYYSQDPIDCSCGMDSGALCACCNPGLFDGSEDAKTSYESSCNCQWTPGDDPNDCNASIVPAVAQPDLEITQKSEEWIDMATKIYEITYTVTNNGDATAGVSTTSIQIDGAEVETDAVPELNDGEQHTNTLGPFTMSDNSDTINVCADKDDTVDESNEANNCLENVFGSFSNNVYLTPAGSSTEYGESATVEVYADTTNEFQGGQFYLDFGESCANITDLTFNSTWLYTSKNFADYTGAVFASFRKDPPMVNGLQHICTLTIQCDNPDYCMTDLHFAFAGEAPSGKDTKLFDDGGNILPDQGWHDGTFTCMNLPDLVITEVYGEQQTGDDYIVHYTVSNEGNAQAQSGHISTLYLDSTFVENKEVPDALAPGESYSGTFDTVLTMTMPNDLMKVCCDTDSDEMELDETNNCMESFYPAGIEIKIDVQDDGECFDIGEQFIVHIDVDPRNIPVYGAQYTLSFDNSALHGEWQNEGNFLNSDGAGTTVIINTINNGLGKISFAATRVGTQDGVTDPGTLAVIKFTAIKPGVTSNLTLSDVIASNVNGDEILPVDLIDDTVCIMENLEPVAIGKSMHEYNNDGTKYLCTSYFNGTESYDPDGEVIYWRWSFGDGEYATGEFVEHIYRSWRWIGDSTGQYEPFNASLTVTDNGNPHELANTIEFDVNVYIAGDANADGKVNILDATLIGLEWGETTTCGAYCWDGDERGDKADLNNDNKVNILDAVIIGTCWGHTAWEG